MTDKEVAMIYAEVDSYLNKLGDEYINKIPEDVLRSIHIFKDKNYQKEIENTENYKPSFNAFMFILYLDFEYWMDEDDEAKQAWEAHKAEAIKDRQDFEEAMNRFENKIIN